MTGARLRRSRAFYAAWISVFAFGTAAPLTAYPAPVAPDWSASATIPPTGRANPYGFSEPELSRRIERGKIHAQVYPVDVTASLVPYQAFRNFLEGSFINPFRFLAQQLVRGMTGWYGFDDMLAWLGLHPYPTAEDTGVYSVPYPNGTRPAERMGFGLIRRDGAEGFSYSCASCHSANLFGKTVLGMTNRFPRANQYFVAGQKTAGYVTTGLFHFITGATEEERRMYKKTRFALRFVGTKTPAAPGLDTSLAQVAISLARRAPASEDEWATRDRTYSDNPRPEFLETFIADSKPAVWWNLKYKTRWLSDGSLISGNPIYTNLLWNELGRGTDLRELEDWLQNNSDVIEDLTTAVFSTEAPKFTDFFPAERFDLAAARRGQAVYKQHCARCHGMYEKGWDLPEAELLSPEKQLETVSVRYFPRTPSVRVGTDPQRALGMRSLETGLNPLAISRAHSIEVREQHGYVPSPLVGIWARWPYLHNNSVPSLCALLTPGPDRPQTYVAVDAQVRDRDFDSECNGYPEAPSASAPDRGVIFDTARPGLSRLGHDEGIIVRNGHELLSPEEKQDLIRFLQTL